MNTKRKGLIVIDMQNDFIDGSLGTKEALEILPTVKAIINAGDYHELYFTRDTHDDNYENTQEGQKLPVRHCIKDTHGWQIHDSLDTLSADKIINKPSFGYTGWSGLLDRLDEINLIGLCTNICVISNALIIKALYPEKTVNIIENATAGVTPESKEAALTTARSCQINITTWSPTEEE